MQPQVDLIQNDVDSLVNSCQEMVEFRLPKTTWVRFMNEGIMDLYDVLYIEAEATLTRTDNTEDFVLPDDFKQMYLIQVVNNNCNNLEPQSWDIGSNKQYDYIFANAVSDGTYSIFNGKLHINGYMGDEIKIKYFRKPQFLAAINGERVPVDLPNEYIEAVKLYACAQAMKAEDETDRYNLFLSSYKSKKDLLYSYANRYRPERKLYWKVRR